MKIIIIGEDIFSVQTFKALIGDGHHILAFITPSYNKNAEEIRKITDKYGVSFKIVNNINDQTFIEYMQFLNPELLVTVHFERLLQIPLLKIPAKGCINIHPSLLPLYKGLAPQHWPIINGDRETGITVHYIDHGMDSGDIILQEKVEIGPDEYISDLQFRMLKMYGPLMCRAIQKITENDFHPSFNDPSKDSYYPKLRFNDTLINLSESKNDIYNLIRGVSSPYLGAHYEDYTIWRAKKITQKEEDTYCRQFPGPGFYEIGNDEAILKVSDGILFITDYE